MSSYMTSKPRWEEILVLKPPRVKSRGVKSSSETMVNLSRDIAKFEKLPSNWDGPVSDGTSLTKKSLFDKIDSGEIRRKILASDFDKELSKFISQSLGEQSAFIDDTRTLWEANLECTDPFYPTPRSDGVVPIIRLAFEPQKYWEFLYTQILKSQANLLALRPRIEDLAEPEEDSEKPSVSLEKEPKSGDSLRVPEEGFWP